jgi:hypothetical protein
MAELIATEQAGLALTLGRRDEANAYVALTRG